MGFFQNLKNKLGIGGVSVRLEIPAHVAKDAGQLQGKMVLTSKSDQEVTSLKIRLLEEYTTGRGDEKKTKEFELGIVTINQAFTIKSGETKEVAFTLPFTALKSNNDQLKEQGGALGALGKMASFADNEKSKYFVDADADVKSAALDPSDKKEIRLM